MTANHGTPAPFGTVLGIAPGNVPAYSSDYHTADETEFPNRHSYRSYIDDVYMGQKWQCVEFARRWLYHNYGYVFDDVAMAHDIYRLRSVRVVSDGTALPVRAFRNGSMRQPVPGCLLIWDEGGDFAMTGHVAVITEVHDEYVRVAEQNVDQHYWEDGRDYSRQLRLRVAGRGEHWIECNLHGTSVLGWIVQTDDDTHAETFGDADPALLGVQLRELEVGANAAEPWLDERNPDEAAYIRMMGGHKLVTNVADNGKYLCISESALAELKRATRELHSLFMLATEHVLRNDRLFERFNIPRSIWPKIRQSWSNRRNEMITGRFDFALSERGLKVYEYNCDSASCHLECGKIQGKWAEHFGCSDGFDAGRNLHERLIQAWKKAEVNGVMHIMHDKDLEETYHALYMQQIAEAAGIRTKVLRGLSGLTWDNDSNIRDADGVPIKWVWKTWAWETALDQIREECEHDEQALCNYRPGQAHNGPPRLVDVLLRKDVMVFEPLWTLIPSNKAILPVLSRLCPNHPYLLNSAFELRDSLRRSGYAVKPIVGRGGSNISLVDRHSNVIAETGGKFERHDQVFQEIWKLPDIAGLNVQLVTFSAGGAYGGASARADRTVVIKMDSDCFPLRVMPDDEFLETTG